MMSRILRTAALVGVLLVLTALGSAPRAEAQLVTLPQPTAFTVSAPGLSSTTSYSYTVTAQWDYGVYQCSNHCPAWRFDVEWDGTIQSAGKQLADSKTFTTPGNVLVRVRLNASCGNVSNLFCYFSFGGLYYRVAKNATDVSKWSDTQTVQLPLVDQQFPTGITTAAPPPAIVDALTGVFEAFGVQDPAPTAHLWSIMLCLLLAVGLAAFCIASTGGGPGSIFLGSLAFLLMFSLAGPTAFGVPSVFAGMALLVPGLGIVLFLKTKVR